MTNQVKKILYRTGKASSVFTRLILKDIA